MMDVSPYRVLLFSSLSLFFFLARDSYCALCSRFFAFPLFSLCNAKEQKKGKGKGRFKENRNVRSDEEGGRGTTQIGRLRTISTLHP